MIERLSETMNTALVSNKFSPFLSKISFHMKKIPSLLPKIYRSLNPF